MPGGSIFESMFGQQPKSDFWDKIGEKDPDNQNHEGNLRSYEKLKGAETADDVRRVFTELGITTMMPNFDEGIIAHKDAMLKQLEGYLKREGKL